MSLLLRTDWILKYIPDMGIQSDPKKDFNSAIDTQYNNCECTETGRKRKTDFDQSCRDASFEDGEDLHLYSIRIVYDMIGKLSSI